MRLWSIHPQYLDSKGLVALWREGLLALNVLQGNTRGYRNHPQLERFKACADPAAAARRYLYFVYQEAESRSYKFNRDKIGSAQGRAVISVTDGQLNYETQHLLSKLVTRDPPRYTSLLQQAQLEPHPMFKVIEGGIADWEVT